MLRHAEITGGSWWRFSRYELRDGLIRPAAGADLERYEPWEEYDNRPGVPASASRSLLQLVDHFSEAGALDWCRAHGLLGILPHRARMVTVAAPGRRGADGLQHRYVRVPGGWGASIVPEMWRSAANAPPPGVLLQDLRQVRLVWEPLGATWARFFPDIDPAKRETAVYPIPLTGTFWRRYGEPLGAFQAGAQALRDALRDADAGADPQRRERGLALLNALLIPIGPSAVIADDGHNIAQQWRCPSLLASFALMALLDLTQGRRVRSCAVCRGTFVSAAYHARYCSVRCRRTGEQRDYRHRRRTRRRRATQARRGKRRRTAR